MLALHPGQSTHLDPDVKRGLAALDRLFAQQDARVKQQQARRDEEPVAAPVERAA